MRRAVGMVSLVVAAALYLAVPVTAETTHARVSRKVSKKVPAPLPSGPQGPLQQFPLDSMPAVAPEVNFQNGQLTIATPNSTLADVLRAVHKQTMAEMDVPANATERVALHLGPGPAREVVATLLNGSRFNYVLLGAPEDATKLTRVVLVAKSGGEPAVGPQTQSPQVPVNEAVNMAVPQQAEEATDATDAEATDENTDENADQAVVEQPGVVPEQGVKTPQQMLQEMQQRQQQLQQGQQLGQPGAYPPPPVQQRQQD